MSPSQVQLLISTKAKPTRIERLVLQVEYEGGNRAAEMNCYHYWQMVFQILQGKYYSDKLIFFQFYKWNSHAHTHKRSHALKLQILFLT